jgi:hypothetical protein
LVDLQCKEEDSEDEENKVTEEGLNGAREVEGNSNPCKRRILLPPILRMGGRGKAWEVRVKRDALTSVDTGDRVQRTATSLYVSLSLFFTFPSTDPLFRFTAWCCQSWCPLHVRQAPGARLRQGLLWWIRLKRSESLFLLSNIRFLFLSFFRNETFLVNHLCALRL